jgi:hypothetical protein
MNKNGSNNDGIIDIEKIVSEKEEFLITLCSDGSIRLWDNKNNIIEKYFIDEDIRNDLKCKIKIFLKKLLN